METKKVLLASPRGYCAGVERAVLAVEKALSLYGSPVYVRKQIVHNSHVVKSLEEKGAVFVEEVQEVPVGSVLIFSAHGVAPLVHEEAKERNLKVIDATCPLVTKVHLEAKRFAEKGFDIFLIGHEGHEEVIGTYGQAPGNVHLVDKHTDINEIPVKDSAKVAYLSQTTLSVDDANESIKRIKESFPLLSAPPSDDICYATQNRQEAVKKIAKDADVVLVVGSSNSSNSLRLVEVALQNGARQAFLIENADALDLDAVKFNAVKNAKTIGVTSGASVPEELVRGVLEKLKDFQVQEIETVKESILFALPQELRKDLKKASLA